MSNSNSYLLAGSTVELDRLRLQAKVFEPSAEAWFDELGIGSARPLVARYLLPSQRGTDGVARDTQLLGDGSDGFALGT